MASTYFSYQSPVQKRLSIYNWNPGPRRGKEDAFEKQIAVKWHIVTLQEASDYVDHDILHNRFHVTVFAGCAILFSKDTFHPDISVKSIYLHDTRRGLQDQVVEGEQDGSNRVFGHAPHFAATSAPKRKAGSLFCYTSSCFISMSRQRGSVGRQKLLDLHAPCVFECVRSLGRQPC